MEMHQLRYFVAVARMVGGVVSLDPVLANPFFRLIRKASCANRHCWNHPATLRPLAECESGVG
jgi:hypothetical protein